MSKTLAELETMVYEFKSRYLKDIEEALKDVEDLARRTQTELADVSGTTHVLVKMQERLTSVAAELYKRFKTFEKYILRALDNAAQSNTKFLSNIKLVLSLEQTIYIHYTIQSTHP